MRTAFHIVSLVIAASFFVACKKDSPPPPAEKVATAEKAATPEKKAWADMSKKERRKVMEDVVHPKMSELFKAFDGEEFAEVKCSLCHGEGAKTEKFEMPNPDLPVLDPKDGFKAHQELHADELKFMGEKVVPTMAKLLDVPKFDPNTGKGFGCGNCHTFE